MEFSVLTGTRPGRPVLLLLLSSGLLVVALGLAWLQVQEAQSLSSELRIEGTPLIVRIPHGWVPSQEEPGVFVLPLDKHFDEQEGRIERRLSFSYIDFGEFVAADKLVESGETDASAAQVGGFPAVEVREHDERRFLGQVFRRERVTRRACTPRGEIIKVEYVALTELSASDLRQLDDVCAALRVDDASLYVEPADAMAAAGFTFEHEAGWRFAGPDVPGVPGVYLGGEVNGLPVWSIGVFRTWLAFGRTADDLLSDYAASQWSAPVSPQRVATQPVRDGLSLKTLRPVDLGVRNADELSVHLVQQSASEVALLVVWGSEASREAARGAADRIVGSLAFRVSPSVPDFKEAERAGTALVTNLDWSAAFRGVWGREPEDTYYLVRQPFREYGYVESHAAIRNDPSAGYRGGFALYADALEVRAEWTLSGNGQGYRLSIEQKVAGLPVQKTVDRREVGSETVHRIVLDDEERSREVSFTAGPAFVCPPAESIVEWQVAGQDEGAWLIEATEDSTAGSHACMLRPLAPEAGGIRRVLLLADYSPFGTVVGFGSGGVWQYQLDRGRRVERISRAEALGRLRPLFRSRH